MSIRSNVDARRFDQRIEIQRQVTSQNPNTGYVTHTWSEVATLWAAVDSARVNNIAASVANEQINAGQIHASRFYSIWIRWRDGLDPSMRVVWNNRILEIKGIPDNQKRGRLLMLFCYDGVSEDGS